MHLRTSSVPKTHLWSAEPAAVKERYANVLRLDTFTLPGRSAIGQHLPKKNPEESKIMSDGLGGSERKREKGRKRERERV